MAFVETLLQAIATGVLVGGVYAMISVGLAIIFGVMRVINFAQGDFMMLGMYFTFYMVATLALNPIPAAFLAGPVFFLFGLLIHRLLLSRVTGITRGGQDAQLIMTLGISLILQNAGLMIFGANPLAIRTTLARQAWEVGPDAVPVFLNKARTVASAVALLMAAGLYLFMNRTRLGKSIRAAADNPEAATYMGIDVGRSHGIAFGLGIAVTAIAGGLVAMYYPLQPYVGLDFVIIMFVSVVLGGLGSIEGAFLGGLIIGLVQQVSTVFLPIQLQNVTIFVVFLLVLYLRPSGLFGRALRV